MSETVIWSTPGVVSVCVHTHVGNVSPIRQFPGDLWLHWAGLTPTSGSPGWPQPWWETPNLPVHVHTHTHSCTQMYIHLHSQTQGEKNRFGFRITEQNKYKQGYPIWPNTYTHRLAWRHDSRWRSLSRISPAGVRQKKRRIPPLLTRATLMTHTPLTTGFHPDTQN